MEVEALGKIVVRAWNLRNESWIAGTDRYALSWERAWKKATENESLTPMEYRLGQFLSYYGEAVDIIEQPGN